MSATQMEPQPSPGLKWPSLWSVAGLALASIAIVLVVSLMVMISSYPEGMPDQPDVALGVAGSLGFQVVLGALALRSITVRNGHQLELQRAFLSRPGRDDLILVLKLMPILLLADAVVLGLTELVGLHTEVTTVDLQVLMHPLSIIASFTLVPVAEELFLRGALYGALLRWGVRVAIGGTILISSLMHWPPAHVVGVLPGMAVYTYLRWRTGRLAPAVVAHAASNALAMGIAILFGSL